MCSYVVCLQMEPGIVEQVLLGNTGIGAENGGSVFQYVIHGKPVIKVGAHDFFYPHVRRETVVPRSGIQ